VSGLGLEVQDLRKRLERAEQERDRLREALKHHLTEKDDPCGDRGVSWPCDVASALLNLPDQE
jgi:hypothetical protein